MKVRLEPFTPAWKEQFLLHRAAIAAALSRLEPSIDHIGSTSLGSIAAKPIVDVLVGIADARRLDETVAPMVGAGYAYVEKFTPGMPYRRFFAKLVPVADAPLPRVLGTEDELAFGSRYASVAHVHVLERDTPHWTRHLAFRDYLIAHPEVRAAYEALKLRIAEQEFESPLDYNAHKGPFIAEHEAKAVAWYSGRARVPRG